MNGVFFKLKISNYQIYLALDINVLCSIKTLRVCLDGERISGRITLFGLVVENNVMLVIS
jgi:hypothetical protein